MLSSVCALDLLYALCQWLMHAYMLVKLSDTHRSILVAVQ